MGVITNRKSKDRRWHIVHKNRRKDKRWSI